MKIFAAILAFITGIFSTSKPTPPVEIPITPEPTLVIQNISPTPAPKLTAKPTIKVTPKPTTSPLIDCTGPDKVHFQSTKADCDNLNNFWKANTPSSNTTSSNSSSSSSSSSNTSTSTSSSSSSPTASISSGKSRGSKLTPGETFTINAQFKNLPNTGERGCLAEGKVEIELVFNGKQLSMTSSQYYGSPWTYYSVGEPKVILAYVPCGSNAALDVTFNASMNPENTTPPYVTALVAESGTPNTMSSDRYEFTW